MSIMPTPSNDLLNSEILAMKILAGIFLVLAIFFFVLAGLAIKSCGPLVGFVGVALIGGLTFSYFTLVCGKNARQYERLKEIIQNIQPSEESIELYGQSRKAVVWNCEECSDDLKYDASRDFLLQRKSDLPLVFYRRTTEVGAGQQSIAIAMLFFHGILTQAVVWHEENQRNN